MKKSSLIALILFSRVATAGATTVVPPADLGELARASEAVTFAHAVESWVEPGETIPVTITRFHLLQTVAGAQTGDVFEVRELGGALEDRAAAVAGAPRYVPGRNYLLFLDRAPGGRWRSKMMSYGLLEEVEGADLLRPLPEAARIELWVRQRAEPVGVYRKAALLEHLAEVARGATWNARSVAADSPDGAVTQVIYSSPLYC